MGQEINTILHGDALTKLKTLSDNSVHCVVTSPPYFGLRDYKVEGQMGLERTPEEYVTKMVEVFREIRRVLRSDGTCWLNIGDSYAGYFGDKYSHKPFGDNREGDESTPPNKPSLTFAKKRITHDKSTLGGSNRTTKEQLRSHENVTTPNLKPKDMIGIPWMLAFALRTDGWWLRSDIIWHKPNVMPESVNDRPTKAHEYLFLLAKSERYFYDAMAISEECSPNTHMRVSQDVANQIRSFRANGGREKPMKAHPGRKMEESGKGNKNNASFNDSIILPVSRRNKRTVWTVATTPFKEAHFATFPEKLIVDCIKAGTSQKGCYPVCGAPWTREITPSERYKKLLGNGYHDHQNDLEKGMKQNQGANRQNAMRDAGIRAAEYITSGWKPGCSHNEEPCPCVVLDPFIGAGTTALVARKLGRNYLGIELSEKYIQIAERRLFKGLGIFI
jgi:DNA modification methylase